MLSLILKASKLHLDHLNSIELDLFLLEAELLNIIPTISLLIEINYLLSRFHKRIRFYSVYFGS